MKLKIISITAIVFSFLLAGFGVWGLFTETGNRAYDEMAGIIPTYSLFISPLILFLGVLGILLSNKQKIK